MDMGDHHESETKWFNNGPQVDRYLLDSPMLPQFNRDADGGLTLHFQNESPGKDKEANWLPAPKGSFSVIMRLYWPKPAPQF